MWIEKINLKHYRNYTAIESEFSQSLNVFVGQNAQGKTNFLEAIYFLSLTRSHRTRSDKELIQFGQKELNVSGLSDYIGTMTVVLFAPEDLQLIKGSPSLRRKFIDIDLGQIKPIYLSDLSNYNHVLKQRNAYLKSEKKVDTDFLFVLDEQLVDYGSKVIEHRLDFIQNLTKEADKYHFSISNQQEHLKISYLSSVKFDHKKNIRDNFLNLLQKNRQGDIFKKNTSVGPHRDDLAFFINQMNASFGSQGQHRSLILSLKLAEIELTKTVTGDYPILLLDDVMSELDNYRQIKLLEGIKDNVQTFITTTSLEHLQQLPKKLKLFTINQGKVLSE